MSHFTQKNAFQRVARQARKERLAEEKKARIAERAADKKRKKELTSVVRDATAKRRKFKELRAELLSELKALLKATKLSRDKLKMRFAHAEKLATKFGELSASYIANITVDDFDLTSEIDIIESAIEEVSGTES